MERRSSKFTSFDGVELAIHEMGQGRPLLLLHGLFSDAHMNWIKFGHAEKLADAGFHVVMPDLRAHGQSDAPHDPKAYPKDVLVKDISAIIDSFGWDEFDLGGFSLGARTTAKLLATGTCPRKAILAGMGLEGLSGWLQRRNFFFTAIDKRNSAKRGDRHWMAIQFMKSQKIDPIAARFLLGTFTDMETADLAEIDVPTLVLCGSNDRDNGSPEKLAAALPDGQHVAIPGTHMNSVTRPELAVAIKMFLEG